MHHARDIPTFQRALPLPFSSFPSRPSPSSAPNGPRVPSVADRNNGELGKILAAEQDYRSVGEVRVRFLTSPFNSRAFVKPTLGGDGGSCTSREICISSIPLSFELLQNKTQEESRGSPLRDDARVTSRDQTILVFFFFLLTGARNPGGGLVRKLPA